jgi:hypothetical protein
MSKAKADARPKAVPAEAKWSAREKEWQLGTIGKETKARSGSWVAWRADGTVRWRGTYAAGDLTGEHTRFHRDGTEARKVTFKNRYTIGVETWTRSQSKTDEPFGLRGEAKTVWRVEWDHGPHGYGPEDKGPRYFLADGTECNTKGIPLATAHKDELFVGVAPQDFICKGGLERFLRAADALGAPSGKRRASATFEQAWGRPMPRDLETFTSLMERAPKAPLMDWKAHKSSMMGTLDALDGKRNLVEHAIVIAQRQKGSACLRELFAGTVALGKSVTGDEIHLGLFDVDMGLSSPHAWHFDVGEEALTAALADDLSRLVYAAALGGALYDEEIVSAQTVGKLLPGLAGHLNRSMSLDILFDSAGVKKSVLGTYKPKTQPARQLSYRSAWIVRALEGQGARAKDAFVAELNGKPTATEHRQRLAMVERMVPTALYSLFRAFFFEEPELVEFVEHASRSSSRIIRDGAALVEDLANGRKKLGTIADVPALKKKLRTLTR